LCSASLPSFLLSPSSTLVSSPLSLHDALPIYHRLDRIGLDLTMPGQELSDLGVDDLLDMPGAGEGLADLRRIDVELDARPAPGQDRKSTRLNSSHVKISYAVFCLKKKKEHIIY